jgi:hypothetical protein
MNEQELKEYQEKVAGYDAKYAAVNAGLPEAGGICYCTMYSRMGVAVNITGRGVNPVRAAEALIEAIALLSPVYHLTPDKQLPQAAAPKPPADVKIAVEAGNKVLAQELQAGYEAVPPATADNPYQIVDIDEIHIEPKADGMVSVEFWKIGRKYCEEYLKWKPESVLGLLKHVMTVKLNDDGTIKPAIEACKCRVYYLLGKEKTGPNAKPGSRWHNVAHVRPIT